MDNKHLAWIDLETTGLDPRVPGASILAIGLVITDECLRVRSAYEAMLAQDAPAEPGSPWYDAMPEVVVDMHARSGLLDKIRIGYAQVSPDTAHDMIYRVMNNYNLVGASPMCGSSITHDRWWLRTFMPKVDELFHYRNIDVSSFKETFARWWPEAPEKLQPAKLHTPLSDIEDSIEEYKSYLRVIERGAEPFPDHIFGKPVEPSGP
jgi:oligoribonuclease